MFIFSRPCETAGVAAISMEMSKGARRRRKRVTANQA